MNHRVSVIGTGRMGSALATALNNKGFSTTVWNRTSSKTAALARLGVRVAESLKAAALASDVVIVSISDYQTTQQLLHDPDVAAALGGKILVQLTSGIPEEAEHMQSWAKQYEISYLDGAIMSYPSGIGAPECTIFYSGPQEVFNRVKSVLMALAGNTLYVGTAIGHASALDLSGLTFVLGAMFGFVQGYIISEAEGLPPEVFTGSIKGMLPVMGEILEAISSRIQKKDYAGSEATLEAWSIGPKELIEWSKDRRMDRRIADAQIDLFEQAIKAGQGQADFAYFYEIFNRNTGKKSQVETCS
jgi:3-hydroxyisobutyrate dehydrogenase-like beta-hydroxyacid dehydrogenase